MNERDSVTFVMSQRAGEKRLAEDFFFLRPMMINIAASTKSEQLEELHTIHHIMYCFFFFFLKNCEHYLLSSSEDKIIHK